VTSITTFIQRALPGPSWRGWRSVIAALLGKPPEDAALVRRIADRQHLPSLPVKEGWIIAGRGSGKSRAVATLGVALATCRTYPHAPGEKIFGGIAAPDRRQSTVTLGYVRGLLRSSTALESLITNEGKEWIELGDFIIEVITASSVGPRGRSYGFFIGEEANFFPCETSSDPDRELFISVRPGLARVKGSMLLVVSSAYARRGELFRMWQTRHDRPDILVIQASTTDLNPAFDQGEIDRAMADDPVSAQSEYYSQWRGDITRFIDAEALQACVDVGVRERPPEPGIQYYAFVDPSGGSQDSMVLAVGHPAGDKAMLDLVREIRAPFDPRKATAELAGVLRPYRVTKVVGDAYSAQWVRSAFDSHGIHYTLSERAKSQIYTEVLALINSQRAALLDDKRLLGQFLGLERRTGKTRDSIDHGPNQHDDCCNAASGALLLCRVGLGRASLPPDFVACLREVNSGGTYDRRGCYLFGGMGGSVDGVEDCRTCPGDRAARALHARYLQSGGTEDLREWAKTAVKLPEALATADWYRRCREDEEAAGRAHDDFLARQRAQHWRPWK
jgi:hypothetical protein